MGRKAASYTPRKSSSTTVRKELETSYDYPPFFQTISHYCFVKSHSLYKIFKRNTIKVSYSCVDNVSQIIKQHNKNVSNKKENQTNSCNCWSNKKCPLNVNCEVHNVICKCNVSATQIFKQHIYLGITEGNWKERLYNHKQSFKGKKYKNNTKLSCYLWDLNENHNQIPKLTWPIDRFSPSYSNISKMCLLCLHEKLSILTYHNPAELLNKRSELIATYRH